MGEIVSSFFMSLDGVVEAPEQWHFPYFDEEMGAAVGRAMEGSAGILMGRRLYDEWSAHWTAQPEDDPMASTFNAMAKYVVSGSLTDPAWQGTTVIGGDTVAGVRDLKERTDGTITMSGSATLVRWLLVNGLLDRLHLMVHPIVVGKGQRLFEDGATHALRLVAQEAFASGVLNLVYAPAGR